jgi:aquaporin Z
MADPLNSKIGLLGVALAHGLALSIAISIFAGISGGHHNPAVTLGFLSTGRIKLPLAILYVIFQLVGATLAAAMCKMIYPESAVETNLLGIPLPGSWVKTPEIVLLTEFICTFLLMTAVYGTAVDERGTSMKLGGFAIGLTLSFCILAAGPVTGASLNPARSFGPAFVHNYFAWHWCYWAGPIAGALAAALIYEHLLLDKDPQTEKV